ncbi:MAG: hypothetical protein FJ386_03875 [Verrucomicrobia bacterium]|nr:hypothetical protein [Verrucomicrobiota bacterium]
MAVFSLHRSLRIDAENLLARPARPSATNTAGTLTGSNSIELRVLNEWMDQYLRAPASAK